MRAEFQVHELNGQGMVAAVQLADAFSSLLTSVESFGVAGRELALVKTKLEEACFFAKRSIASNPANQEP